MRKEQILANTSPASSNRPTASTENLLEAIWAAAHVISMHAVPKHEESLLFVKGYVADGQPVK